MIKENIPHGPPETNSGHEQSPKALLALSPELRQRNMFCLHGISLDTVGYNSLLSEATGLEERFRITIADKPVVSASVYAERATTSQAPLWSNVGVIIGEGRIQAASPTDISSLMLPNGERQTSKQSLDEIREALDAIAANNEKYPDYPLINEVAIREPTVTGLYFKDTAGLMPNQINTLQVTAPPNTVPEIVRKVSSAFGLPIFAVRTSGIFEVKTFDPVTGSYQFSSETTPRVRAAEMAAHHLRTQEIAAFGHAIVRMQET